MAACICLYTIAGLAFLAIITRVLSKEQGSKMVLTPLVGFCANELFFVWPAPLFALATGVVADYYAAMVVLSSTFAFLLGYLFMRTRRNWSYTNALTYCRKPLIPTWPQAHLLAIAVTSAILIALGTYLYRGVPSTVVAMTQIISEGHDSDVTQYAGEERLRLTKGHYFGGEYRGQGLVRKVMWAGWPVLATIAILLFYRRPGALWGCLAILLTMATIIYIAGDGTRAPVLWALISIVCSLSLVINTRLRTWIILCVVLFALLAGLSITKKLGGANAPTLAEAAEQLVERVFVGNAINTIHVIELVRSGQLSLHWGDICLTDALNTLPFYKADGTPFAHELFLILHPGASFDQTTFASMTFLGKLYGDLGWLGSVIGYFCLGAFVAVASAYLFSTERTLINVTFAGAICFRIGQLNLNGPVPLCSFVLMLVVVKAIYTASYQFGCYFMRADCYAQHLCSQRS